MKQTVAIAVTLAALLVGSALGQEQPMWEKMAGIPPKSVAGQPVAAPTKPTKPTTLPGALVLQDGTPIKLRTAENLSSHDAVKGNDVNFEVVEDVYVGDVLVIKKGSPAIGTITEAQRKKTMGRQGKLDITIDYARLINGEKAMLRGVQQGNGGGHTGAMVTGMVVTSLVFWPAAPFFLFMHGKDFNIPKGTPTTVFVAGDTTYSTVAVAH
jgi:hypothetical protein